MWKKSLKTNQIIMGYLLIIPAVVFFLIFFGYSLLQAVRYSTLDWDGVLPPMQIGMQKKRPPKRSAVILSNPGCQAFAF